MDRIFLAVAILSEVAATSALKSSEGFSRLLPSIIVVIGYGVSFFLLSLALRSIPVAVAYAIWSGVGQALIAAVAWFAFRQTLNAGELAGMGLIVAGVVTLGFFSNGAH
ncbi:MULTISPECIES: DMT family transporter [Methylosinus]|uniref:QacE family quaternary ammonium compound efflux SMR transporter n=1 Tax=Methylosinus trichosporium (strain ATCC 35070 / NCIMB 11131 / UNIQEM 75 / OB3b) TaxID=595536 RepID=A0A2D2CVH5_METT3|nr:MULTISPECIES: multidrug efflux SMR transporter [Methylosinus]ATQ66737.1 QacE family quaternary ammonium compound efflux SMR transporter [Methylosinus trichosporium OB3b]OBS53403.1 multidrug transporter [Methylosinus sp. 3S-1]